MACFAVLACFLASPSRLAAQAAAPGAAAAATYSVGSVTVKFVGAANVSEQVVRANMQAREGSPIDDAMIDQDIRSLYRTGLFEFIEVKRDARPDRTVNLLIEVTPKFRVLAVRFEGNKRVKSRRLEKEVKTKDNLALDERQVKEDGEKLREYYQKTGYNQASITYSIERDRSTGFGTVTFKIKEGEKVRISGIDFEGNNNIKARRLRKEMETKRWWIFSWLTGSGRLKDDEFEDDLEKVRDYYREEGFLDVAIDADKIRYEYPTPNKLQIVVGYSTASAISPSRATSFIRPPSLASSSSSAVARFSSRRSSIRMSRAWRTSMAATVTLTRACAWCASRTSRPATSTSSTISRRAKNSSSSRLRSRVTRRPRAS